MKRIDWLHQKEPHVLKGARRMLLCGTFHGALLAFCATLFTACGSSKPAAPVVIEAVPTALQTLSPNDRSRLDYFYQEATKQKMLDNHVAAFDLLQHCLQICPEAPEVLYEKALYHLFLRQDSLGLAYLQRAADNDPRNTYYKEALATYYMNRQDAEKALPYLESLAQLLPRRSDILAQLVTIYRAADRPEDAIHALDRIEVLEGKMASVSYQKFALYQQMGQEKKAFAELESLCKEYPHEMSYRLAIGNQLLEADRVDEALKVYEQVRKAEPENPSLQLSMLQYYRHTEDSLHFYHLRDSLLYAPRTESNVRVALLRDLISDEMHGDSLGPQRINNAFDSLDRQWPKDLDLLQLKAAYLTTYDQKNDSGFVAVMDRVHELEPANTQALFYLIQYYGEHQDFKRLEDLCRRGVLTHPEELICHFYLGVALYQQDKKPEAMKAFQDGIVQKTDESRPSMVADLYSILGDLYHEMGRDSDAYAAYDSCLTYQSDNASCLNNYAYYLSLENRNLDRAEEMSYRSIRLEPKNKTFLDTYAWILFMKKRYSEAQHYIDRVCPPDSTDSVLIADNAISGVVLEHAGDIAACNGKTEQALRFWTLAQKAGGDGLTALLPKKIKMKKFVEN
ncbi:MAG: hypothetical protein K6A32_09830 [Bacteroidales bacterium]|nr:hypothetical protein [Bacteroidales bacterium]